MSEQITTAAELDALPVGSVVRGDLGQTYARYQNGWLGSSPRAHELDTSTEVWFPVTVLYRPDAPVAAGATVAGGDLVATGFDDVGHPVVWEDRDWVRPVAGPARPPREGRTVLPDHYGDGSLEVLYRAEVPAAPLTISTTGHWSIDVTLDGLLGAIADAGGPDLRPALGLTVADEPSEDGA